MFVALALSSDGGDRTVRRLTAYIFERLEEFLFQEFLFQVRFQTLEVDLRGGTKFTIR